MLLFLYQRETGGGPLQGDGEPRKTKERVGHLRCMRNVQTHLACVFIKTEFLCFQDCLFLLTTTVEASVCNSAHHGDDAGGDDALVGI